MILELEGSELPGRWLFLEHDPRVPKHGIVTLDGAGHMTWSGQPIDLNGLREHVHATGPHPLWAHDIAVAPTESADFRSLYAVSWVIGLETGPALVTCADPPGPGRVSSGC